MPGAPAAQRKGLIDADRPTVVTRSKLDDIALCSAVQYCLQATSGACGADYSKVSCDSVKANYNDLHNLGVSSQ